MTDERRSIHRRQGSRAGRFRRAIPAACLLVAMLGLLRAAVPAGASANLHVSPGIIDFGNVPVGGSSTQSFTLVNAASIPLASTGTIQITGNLPGSEFTIQSATVPPIPPFGSVTWNLTFHPTQVETLNNLFIDFQDPNSTTVRVTVRGFSPPPPTSSQLIVSPDTLDFGAVNVGDQQTLAFTLRNAGSGRTGSIQTASNLPSPQFTIPVNSISPLDPGDSTTWSVTFHPTTAGIVSGYVRFADPNGGPGSTLVTVNVQGRGVAPPPSQLIVSPDTLDFGAVNVGDRATLTLMLRNIGSGPTGTIQVAGNLSGSQFSIQSNSISPLAPGGPPTTWSVTFHPTTVGIVSGFLRFTDPNGGTASTQVLVNVLGRGAAAPVPPPQISVSPGTLDFGSVTVGQQLTRNFTVTNTGGSDLIITGVENDLDGTEFSLGGGGGGGAPLHPGGSQLWTVTFHPTQTATYNTSIVLDHNAAGSPTRVFIKAIAVTTPTPTPTPTPAPTITGYAATNPRGVPINSGPPGAPLLILGSNLGTGGSVAFNGLAAAPALSWSASEIVVIIPTAPSYPYSGPVAVTVNGQTATGPTFTITAPANPTPTPGLMGGDWPVFMQGPAQSGRAGFTLDPLTLSPWSVSLGSKPGASPVMAGGVAYIGTESNGLFAIDTATHKVRWNQVLGAPIRSAPAVGPQTIVVAATNGLYGLNPQDGTVRWGPRKEITPFGTVSPMIVGNTVYIGGPGPGGFANALYAVNASTGDLVWPAPAALPAAALSTVAVDTDRGLLFVALGQPPAPGQPLTAPSAVLALRLADGSMAWPAVVLPVPAPAGLSLGQVAGAGGAVPAVFVAAGSTVTALDATKGTTLWSRSLLPETGLQGPPVVSAAQPGATLFVRSSQGRIYALAADSGADAAGGRSSTLAPITGTLALAGKLLLAPTETGLVAVDVATGTPVWTGDAPGASGVAIAGNSLLLGTADGRLAGFSGTVRPLP